MNDTLYRIRLLMVVRVVAVTTLLVAAFLVEIWFHPARSLRPLYILTAVTFALTIVYGLLYSVLKDRAVFAYLQLAGDILTSTGFVYVTGSVASPFSFLYVPVILAGGLLLFRRGAFTVAALSCVAYGGLTVLMVTETLPPYPPGSFRASPTEVKRASFSMLVHFLGFGLVGALASTLSESLRRTGEELGATRENLEDLQAFNALIIDSVNSGLVTTDTDGSITFLNRAAREITGLAESVVRGRSMEDVFGLDEEFGERLAGALAQGPRFRFEAPFHVTRNVLRVLGFTAGVLRDKADRPLGYIFTFQDLTEIKSLEREVLMRERMAAVGEMAAGMAHELRNPLASMSGSVQVLGSAIPDELGDQRELLGIIQRESLRLDQVLKDFLAFARPRPFQPEAIDLVPVLQEFVRLLENSPEMHGTHRVVTRFSARSLPCRVDVNRMKQVFWNLASNALRAMPDGGDLRLSAELSGGDAVVVSFQDSGRGMDPDEVKDYFRPFRSRFDGGTGLGTAIVYRIIEEHGGRVAVDSRPGQGTTVTLAVPLAPSNGMKESEWQGLNDPAS